MPETICSLVEIPVPSQAKLHKQWCLFDQVPFYIHLSECCCSCNPNLISARGTSTLTGRCGRSLDPRRRQRSKLSQMRRPLTLSNSRGRAYLFLLMHLHLSFASFRVFILIAAGAGEGEGGELRALTKQPSSLSSPCSMSRSITSFINLPYLSCLGS